MTVFEAASSSVQKGTFCEHIFAQSSSQRSREGSCASTKTRASPPLHRQRHSTRAHHECHQPTPACPTSVLCRMRHNSCYAEAVIMPNGGVDALVGAADGVTRSA